MREKYEPGRDIAEYMVGFVGAAKSKEITQDTFDFFNNLVKMNAFQWVGVFQVEGAGMDKIVVSVVDREENTRSKTKTQEEVKTYSAYVSSKYGFIRGIESIAIFDLKHIPPNISPDTAKEFEESRLKTTKGVEHFRLLYQMKLA